MEERGLESCLTWKEVHRVERGGAKPQEAWWACSRGVGGGRWTTPGRAAVERTRCLSRARRGSPELWSQVTFVPAPSAGREGGPWRRSGRWASPPRPGLDPGPAGFWTLAVTRHSKLGRGTCVASSQRPSAGHAGSPGSSCLAHGVGREGGRDGVFGFLGRNRPRGRGGRVLANQEETTGRRLARKRGWSTGRRPATGTFQHVPERARPLREKPRSVQLLREALRVSHAVALGPLFSCFSLFCDARLLSPLLPSFLVSCGSLTLPLSLSPAVSASMPPVRPPTPTPLSLALFGSPRLRGSARTSQEAPVLRNGPSTFFFFFCFLILYFLIHPFLSTDSLTVSSETFWSPHISPSIFISKHPNFFLGPPRPHAACREGSAPQGPWMGQEAAGRWVAGREVRLLTWTPERPLRQEGATVSPQLIAPEAAPR